MSEIKAAETQREIPEKIDSLEKAIATLKERAGITLPERLKTITERLVPESHPVPLPAQDVNTDMGTKLLRLTEEVKFIDVELRCLMDRIQL